MLTLPSQPALPFLFILTRSRVQLDRPPALKPEHIAILHDIVTERAQASLKEIADELYHRCRLRVCDATIRRALRAQGIVRLDEHRHVGQAVEREVDGVRLSLPPYTTRMLPRP